MQLYDIIRFYAKRRKPETIRTGQTLEAVQKWCNDPTTKKDGVYFDGYQKA